MANKTKAELMEEVKTKNDEIKALKAEIEKLDRYKQYQNCTDEIAALRDSFVESGFTKTEAFTMVQTMLKLASNPFFMNLK